MKRKTSTTPTKIWSFGALPPTSGAEGLSDQLFFGSRYYNTLIEIERRRREKFRLARSEAAPALGKLEEEWKKLDELLTAGIDALPKSGKGKKILTPDLTALKAQRAVVSAQMKAERERFKNDTEALASIKLVDESAQLEVKAARAATDLYWGSYLLIEKQIEQARQSKLDPRFRRFEGSGRVGVQLQGGLSLAELESGEDTRLRLVARSTPSKPPHSNPTRNPKARHEVHLRIGSDGRQPIWAVLPVVLHREIPADAKIQWAWIKIKTVGGTRKYFLQLVMESETFSERSLPGAGVVAVNLGWRAHDDGRRRVAYAVDDSGVEQEFCIPAQIERDLSYAHGLRSARDLHFEEAKRAVGAFMAIHDVPEWFKEETKHLWQWRSPKKLAKVSARLVSELLQGDDAVARWRAERLTAPKRDLFAPAAEVFAWLGKWDLKALAIYLQLWRNKNLHLWRWEDQLRARSLAHRNELFRVWSRRLADRYAEIRIEEFDLREMAKIPEPTEEGRPKVFRQARAAAAPGEFRSRLTEVGGHKMVKAPAHGNTVTCFECRHIGERSTEHLVTCAGCGKVFDQDANNCRNQLRERPGGDLKPAGARNPENPGPSSGVTSGAEADDATPRDIVAAE